MAQKKYKKRHSQSTINAKRLAVQAEVADQKDRERKRMNPVARNLLFADLIFLAACQLLDSKGLISPLVSGLSAIIGMIALLLALWFQFVRGSKGGGRSL